MKTEMEMERRFGAAAVIVQALQCVAVVKKELRLQGEALTFPVCLHSDPQL